MNFFTLIPGKVYLLTAVFGAGLMLGQQCASHRYQTQLASLQQQAAEQQVEAVTEVLNRERKIQADFAEAERQAAEQRSDLDSRYHDALDELERLRQSAGDDAVQVPTGAAAGSAGGAAEPRDCRRDREGLADLQKRILELGRDRDRCAVRYNELLELYKVARRGVNETQQN